MKNILYICFTLLVSCVGTDQVPYQEFSNTISNNSGFVVEIIPYDSNGIKDLSKKIKLENGQSINKKIKAAWGGRAYLPSLIYEGKLSKIDIVFNNTRKSTFTDDCIYNNGVSTNCNSRNIFLLEYNDDKTEVYTITPEDYQNAVDCGGNCN